MRIGIVTHRLGYNYGGLLQNYALQQVLKRLGHNPVTLNPDPYIPFDLIGWIKSFPKMFAYKYYLKIPRIHLFEAFSANKIRRIIMQNLQLFIDNNINYVNVKDYATLNENDFDALIAGSDQIWRSIYVKPIENGFFSFAEQWKSVRRLSYAASFGTDEWEYTDEETANCKRLIQLFDAVSVREDSGIDLCKKYFGVKAIHVLDPTLLLTQDDYMAITSKADIPKSPGDLLNYILDENEDKLELIDKVITEKGLTAFKVNGKPEGGYPVKERIQPPIESWIRGFYDAKFVITDSFHACVFSIIFNKPFIVYANKQRGYERFRSLLEVFGLENRLINNTDEYCPISDDIDWNHVNSIIKIKQEEAINFIKESLTPSH